MVSKKVLNTVLASAVALTIAGASTNAVAMDMKDKEKCYGVVKAGANDCGNAAKTHSCAGHAATDAEGGEWLALPAGVCERLAGGSVTPVMDKKAYDHGHEEHHKDGHGDH
jgi:uncharacterized membrane protein